MIWSDSVAQWKGYSVIWDFIANREFGAHTKLNKWGSVENILYKNIGIHLNTPYLGKFAISLPIN